MADNSISIRTEIQTRQAEVQLATLENHMMKTAEKAEELRNAMSDLESKNVETEEYKAISDQIARAKTEMNKLIEKQMQMEAEGKQGTAAYSSITSKITELQNEIDYANGELQDLVDNGEAFKLGADTEEYDRLRRQLEEVEREMDIQNQKHDIMTDKMNESGQATKKFTASLGKIKGVLSKVGAFMGKAFKSIGGAIKNGLVNILKLSVGIQALMAVLQAIKNVAGEVFQEMAKQVPEVNDNLSRMFQALHGLKASVGTMLQPLLSMVSGLISEIINKVTALATAIGGVMARLTGQNYIYKATAAQFNYAESLEKTAKSAKKANKQLAAFDELNVLSSDDDSSGGGGGDDGPLAIYSKEMLPDSIANLGDMIKEMWAKADFTELGTMLGTKLQEALNMIDWEQIQSVGMKVGSSLATFINGFVSTEGLGTDIGVNVAQALNTVIYSVQEFMTKLDGLKVGEFIGNMFNGLVDVTDWSAAGNTVAETLNNLADMIFGTFDTFAAWEGGSSIAEMVTSFFTDTDWGQVGNAIGTFVSDALELLTAFIYDFDWGSIIQGAWDLIIGIDWVRLLGDLMLAIIALYKAQFAIGAAVWQTLSKWLGDLFTQLGWDGVAGFFYGINDMFQWLKDGVFGFFDKIVNAIKDFLGIHSPSRVFAEIGNFLIMGLVEGIKKMASSVVGAVKDIWDKVKNGTIAAWETIKSKVLALLTGIKNIYLSIFQGIWNGIKAYINFILSGIEMMANGIIKGVNLIIKTLNNFDFDIPDWVPGIGGKNVGFDIPLMNEVQLPRLAQGAVIPPNKEFMAVLGDQKNGTNIEAPLDTIKEALIEALAQYGMAGNGDTVVNIDGYEVFRAVRKQSNLFKKSTGLNAF